MSLTKTGAVVNSFGKFSRCLKSGFEKCEMSERFEEIVPAYAEYLEDWYGYQEKMEAHKIRLAEKYNLPVEKLAVEINVTERSISVGIKGSVYLRFSEIEYIMNLAGLNLAPLYEYINSLTLSDFLRLGGKVTPEQMDNHLTLVELKKLRARQEEITKDNYCREQRRLVEERRERERNVKYDAGQIQFQSQEQPKYQCYDQQSQQQQSYR